MTTLCPPKWDYECPRCFLDFLRSITLSMACNSCSSFSLLLSDFDFSFPLLLERLLFSELLCAELCKQRHTHSKNKDFSWHNIITSYYLQNAPMFHLRHIYTFRSLKQLRDLPESHNLLPITLQVSSPTCKWLPW